MLGAANSWTYFGLRNWDGGRALSWWWQGSWHLIICLVISSLPFSDILLLFVYNCLSIYHILHIYESANYINKAFLDSIIDQNHGKLPRCICTFMFLSPFCTLLLPLIVVNWFWLQLIAFDCYQSYWLLLINDLLLTDDWLPLLVDFCWLLIIVDLLLIIVDQLSPPFTYFLYLLDVRSTPPRQKSPPENCCPKPFQMVIWLLSDLVIISHQHHLTTN